MSDPQDLTVDFSQTPGTNPTAGTGPPRDGPGLPDSIGRYRVLRILGQGGFGLVYLATDEQLDRQVAVKVPHGRLVSTPEEASAYLDEARTVARLDHPQIVPVYDVGSTEAFPCFVVSKFIDGMDLETRMRQSRLGPLESASLVASVAMALDYAHKQGLVHRDIKPGNILLDRSGKPYVGDFGLALREQDVGKGPRFAGTPSYMSPEQASGEGHRVDCRSDVFSLGVMLYQLLANRLPFRAPNQEQLLDLITTQDPVPLRQLDETIDGELERICARAMAKRGMDRYATAREFAEDLSAFLGAHQTQVGLALEGAQSGLPGSTRFPSPTPKVGTVPQTTSGWSDAGPGQPPPIKIVPKGLRSFDGHDAGFFLDLLPGPRDRTGLPESIRFWKKRIENPGPDAGFPVGLLYGPSGCGKSSLVKAGLLPRLAESVVPIFLEASPQGTEVRLLKELKRRFPALEQTHDLKEAMASLRKGMPLAPGQKALIVIDQFEQWLHSRGPEGPTDLVQAFRQCDGMHLQAMVLVRDDFWLATSRFLRELEVQLIEGQNCALVDLFPLRHAEKVLASFGWAHGCLGANSSELTRDQKQFLEKAIAGLAQESNVIPVRIALFAEMFKGKEWSVANLKSMGGAEGVGVAFLEETFAADSAPVEHRLLLEPIRAFLGALLPDSGSNLRGHMKSQNDLMVATRYQNDPKGFEGLLAILDQKLRLITPADPDGKPDRDQPASSGKPSTTVLGTTVTSGPEPAKDRYFQLTHDYLVPSLRSWLTRKQKETWKGRVELMFADRVAIWHERPENRQLPSLWQWMQIRWFVPARLWNAPQTRIMAQANRFHGFRAALVALVVMILTWGGWELQGRVEARRLMDRLLESSPAELPTILGEMGSYRRWLSPLLEKVHAEAEGKERSGTLLRTSLGLWSTDGKEATFLFDQLLQAPPLEFLAIRGALRPQKQEWTPRLWSILETSDAPPDQRFRAACALALYDPEDARWTKWTDEVVSMLVTQKPFVMASWADALVGIKPKMMEPLAKMLVDENRGLPDRGLIATIYGRLGADSAEDRERLKKAWDTPSPSLTASEEIQTVFAKRKASVGLALVSIGEGRQVWAGLGPTEDPTVRGYLINRMAPWGIEPETLIREWRLQTDPTIKRSLLLCLGGYTVEQFSDRQKRQWIPTLSEQFRDDPNPANHAAAEWLLKRWGEEKLLETLESALATGKLEGNRRWYLTRQGQTMIQVFRQKVEGWDEGGLSRSTREIARDYALSSKEVTVGQFARFRGDQRRSSGAQANRPIGDVTWYDAAAYCNWLSEQEGIPRDQWCFLPGKNGKYDETLHLAPNYWKLTGYRLPTELEWEIACHGGSVTRFSFGDSIELFEKNGWFDRNSYGKSHGVGLFPSNDFGFFDLHGNVNEWCLEKYKKDGFLIEEAEEGREKDVGAELKFPRVVRGGSYNDRWDLAQTGERNWVIPTSYTPSLGFRVARTLKP